MGRRRLPEEERKEFVGIRIPKWLKDRILEDGSLQEVIEKILKNFYKNKK